MPLLGLSGLIVGMLYSFDHFAAPALAPVAWNFVVIGCLIALPPLFSPDHRIYAYAIGVLAGTVVQLLLPIPWLRGRGGHFTFTLAWRNVHVRRMLKLMLPVTIALGVVSLNLLVDSFFATLVSSEAPAAIDRGFRLSQVPQGLFSVAIATILFPTLARHAVRGERRPAACADGGRRAADLPAADSRGGADDGPGGAGHAARLPARGVHGERHAPGIERDRVLGADAPLRGYEPPLLAHVLQPPAHLDHHLAGAAPTSA